MNAVVKAKREPGLWLEEVPVPEVGSDDVLIRVLKASICGTDVHIYNWDDWAQKTIPVPMTIGHEFAGVVDAVGDHVKGFARGDLVVGEGHITCGHCRNCLAGRRHLCPNTFGVGVNRPGAWAEFVAIPQENCWHADPSIPLDVLSCFDPLGNAVHTALSFDLVGEDLLITGAGPIGCMAIPICKRAGARHVVVTDVNPYRLNLARTMGADLALDVRTEKIAGAMQKLGMKEGFDVALEMSGKPERPFAREDVNWCYLEEARAMGRGMILVTAHTGSWEVGGRLLAEYRGIPTTINTPNAPTTNSAGMSDSEIVAAPHHTPITTHDSSAAAIDMNGVWMTRASIIEPALRIASSSARPQSDASAMVPLSRKKSIAMLSSTRNVSAPCGLSCFCIRRAMSGTPRKKSAKIA